jgi:hypothetical protein
MSIEIGCDRCYSRRSLHCVEMPLVAGNAGMCYEERRNRERI